MSKHSAPMYVPWTALVFALLGLAWCGYIAFPTANAPLCETSGCALIQDGKIGGISLWWIGGAYFFLQCVLCLRGKRIAAWMLARLALFLDCLLLLVMFFTGPCFNCLAAAIFFALSYFSLRPSAGGWFLENPPSPLLLPIWLGLFLGNTVTAVNEIIPYPRIGNAQNTEARIYFSPSCLYCREALVAFGDSAALYPVKEKDGDTEAILRLRALLQANVPMQEALVRSLSSDEPVPPLSTAERLAFELQLLRNKAVILRQGIHALPLILVNGMPAKEENPGGARPQGGDPQENLSGSEPGQGYGGMTLHNGSQPTGNSPPDFLRDTSNLNTCGGADTEPCPE